MKRVKVFTRRHEDPTIRLLLLRPPPDWNREDPEVRRMLADTAAQFKRIINGTPLVILPHDWGAALVDVDGIGLDDD